MSVKYDNQIIDIRTIISDLINIIIEADKMSLEAFNTNDKELYKQAEQMLLNIRQKGDIIDNQIVKTFALYGPEATELRSLVAYLKMTNEIIRIGIGVQKYAIRMSAHLESDCNLTPLSSTIVQLHKSTIIALEYIHKCFKDIDACEVENFFRKIMVEESKNDDYFSILEKDIMNIIIEEKELSVEYVKVLGTLRKLERSCDRSVNIANLIMYAKNGGEINN